jgi:prepilin-type N-terminal cleavage/methylation domain-containing protein
MTPLRRGLTLVELLVVVAILVTLMAVTVPMMRPALEGRERREAARQINAFLGAAQARAMARGRPVGVMFHRQPSLPQASFQMSIAEVPAPYAGDTARSRAFITKIEETGQGAWMGYANLTESWNAPMLVSRGDLIQFGYRGSLYEIASDLVPSATGTTLSFRPRPSDTNAVPPLVPNPVLPLPPNVPLAFQITRKPARTPAAPLELPAPAVVDLAFSGIGPSGIGDPVFVNPGVDEREENRAVTIMFSPSGRVDRVLVRGAADVPLGAIHLLVGRTDQLGLANLSDAKSLWVSIGHRTGRITTAPNQGGPNITGPEKVALARQLALRAQGMGGQ